jgi:hypothetical protein
MLLAAGSLLNAADISVGKFVKTLLISVIIWSASSALS